MMARNEWILEKRSKSWYIGLKLFNGMLDTYTAYFCDSDLCAAIPSLLTLPNRAKVRVKVTRTARPHAVKMNVSRGLYGPTSGNVFSYKLGVNLYPLSIATKWLNKICNLIASNQSRDIWVSFRKVK